MRIECSDNLEFMKSIEDESIDLIYCDILYYTIHLLIIPQASVSFLILKMT